MKKPDDAAEVESSTHKKIGDYQNNILNATFAIASHGIQDGVEPLAKMADIRVENSESVNVDSATTAGNASMERYSATHQAVKNQESQKVAITKEGVLSIVSAKQTSLLGANGDVDMKTSESRNGNDEYRSIESGVSANEAVPTSMEAEAAEPQRKKQTSVAVHVEVAEPVRKSQRARVPTSRLIAIMENDDEPTFPSPPPKTPQDLYDQIKKSRDKLFFIAYSHSKDPLIVSDNVGKNKGVKKNATDYHWYLVRVDLSTCLQLDDTEQCQKTGKYYVEFYTKASYDQGILLAGNPLENGVPAAKMKPKPDNESRYWLEWHEYYFAKNGDMVVGKAKEFLPNSKKAINRRLMDLSQRKQSTISPLSPGSTSDSGGEERLMSEYHPDFDKYTTWADVLDLMDPKTRLVGPFDFDDVKPPPLTEDYLKMFSKETQKLLMENHIDLYVKDRIHLSRWEELLEAIHGRGIDPPTIILEKSERKKKRFPGSKRVREEPMERVSQSQKRARGEKSKEPKPLLHFPATSSKPPLHVHASGGRKNHNQSIVSREKLKENIYSIVEATFNETRYAVSGDGKAYYVLGEFKDALNQVFRSWMGGRGAHASSSLKGGKLSSNTDESVEPLEGLPESDFAEEEVHLFPVAFAYFDEDPGGISEENAKIAALDHEVEQRRLKRSANINAGHKGQSKSFKGAASDDKIKEKSSVGEISKKPFSRRSGHPTLGEKDAHIAPEPAKGLPDGWVIRKVPRGNKPNSKLDPFYYSPKLQFRFRSKAEVRRFLEAMKLSGEDEALAMEKFRN